MKKILTFLVNAGTLSIVLSSILPSVFPNIWFIDIFSNFKLQIIIVSLFLFFINLLHKKNKLIGATLCIMLIWNASFIYSLYYSPKFETLNKNKEITMASINLLSSNNKSKKVIDYIKTTDPDILILLEYNSKWEKLLLDITNTYKFHKTEVRNDNFGIGYFSKIESETTILNFDNSGVPSIRADLHINNEPLTIIATHPFPPAGRKAFESRNLHLETIAKQRPTFSKNLIVAGDLNTSSYSNHFQTFLSEANLKDSRKGYGILPTWPENIQLVQTTLDHFLTSKNIHVKNRTIGTNIGSDHLPIFMKFTVNTF